MWEQTRKNLEETMVQSRSKNFRRNTLKNMESYFLGLETFSHAQYAEYIVFMAKEEKRNQGFIRRTIWDINNLSPLSDGVPAMTTSVLRTTEEEYTVEDIKYFLLFIEQEYYRAAASLRCIGYDKKFYELLTIKISDYDKKNSILAGIRIPRWIQTYIDAAIDITIEHGGDNSWELFRMPKGFGRKNFNERLISNEVLNNNMKRAQVHSGKLLFERYTRLRRGYIPMGLIRY